jgi:hypothetical protein
LSHGPFYLVRNKCQVAIYMQSTQNLAKISTRYYSYKVSTYMCICAKKGAPPSQYLPYFSLSSTNKNRLIRNMGGGGVNTCTKLL